MSERNDDTPNLARRALLRRIGLAAGAVYVAPTLLHIGAARASTPGGSGPSGGGRGGNGGGRGGNGGGRGGSGPSGPSRSGNSRPSGPGQRGGQRTGRQSRPGQRSGGQSRPARRTYVSRPSRPEVL